MRKTTNESLNADDREFVCAACGLKIRSWERIMCNNGREFTAPYILKYCPECGRKIV